MMGANLATIHGPKQHQQVLKEIGEHKAWIGLSKNETWRWVDGQFLSSDSVFSAWSSGKPTSSSKVACVYYDNKVWIETTCNMWHNAVCEFK